MDQREQARSGRDSQRNGEGVRISWIGNFVIANVRRVNTETAVGPNGCVPCSNVR